MNKKYILLLAGLVVHHAHIVGMEPKQQKGPSFGTQSSLILQLDDFDSLLSNNAIGLRGFIAQDPVDTKKLHTVEQTLEAGLKREHYGRHSADVMQFARLIVSRKKDWSLLELSIDKGNSYGAEKIIEQNPYLVSYPCIYGDHQCPPLHYVLHQVSWDKKFSDEQTLPIVRALLKAGANPNSANHYGNTCMHFVSTTKQIDLLLQYGAKINAQSMFGCTPLMDVHSYGHRDILQHLLHAGADPDVRDAKGYTMLHRAVIQVDAPTCCLLLRYGASFMIPDEKDKTAACYLEKKKKADLKKIIEPYMQQFLWNKIRGNDFETVNKFLMRYPWISFIVDGKQMVEWVQEYNYGSALSFKLMLQEKLVNRIEEDKDIALDEVRRYLSAGAAATNLANSNILLPTAIASNRKDLVLLLCEYGVRVWERHIGQALDDDMRALLERAYEVQKCAKGQL